MARTRRSRQAAPGATGRTSIVERRSAAACRTRREKALPLVGVGAVLLQVLGDRELPGPAVVARPSERRPMPDRVLDVQPRPSLDEQSDHGLVAGNRGLMKRRRVTVIPAGIVSIRVFASVEQ